MPLALVLSLIACEGPGVGSPVSDGLAAQGVPESLAGEWVRDAWGQTWLAVDWEAMRAELLAPGAGGQAEQVDCEVLGLAELAYVPGACAVPGTEDPDTLIAQGRLDEVIWATGYTEPIARPVAVHHANRQHGELRPAKLSAIGTRTWLAVSCGDRAETAPWSTDLDQVQVGFAVGPSRTPGARSTDRATRQAVGTAQRAAGLAGDTDGLTLTHETRRLWVETGAHWSTETGLVGDAQAARLVAGPWEAGIRSLCRP